MIAPWVSEYVGIPYLLHGSDRNGADCWGLVRLILREQFGVELPEQGYEAGVEGQAAAVSSAIPFMPLDRVYEPRIGDLVLMRIRLPCHVGLVIGVESDPYNLIHTVRPHDSVVERYNNSRWMNRVEGFYRAT